MGAAADRYAAVTREQWNNYKQFGIPIENKLLGMMNNKGDLATNLSAVSNLVRTSGDVSASETNRALGQYGVLPTADQQRVNARLNNLSTTASMADARNYVRQEDEDLSQTILSGAPNSGLNTV